MKRFPGIGHAPRSGTITTGLLTIASMGAIACGTTDSVAGTGQQGTLKPTSIDRGVAFIVGGNAVEVRLVRDLTPGEDQCEVAGTPHRELFAPLAQFASRHLVHGARGGVVVSWIDGGAPSLLSQMDAGEHDAIGIDARTLSGVVVVNDRYGTDYYCAFFDKDTNVITLKWNSSIQ